MDGSEEQKPVQRRSTVGYLLSGLAGAAFATVLAVFFFINPLTDEVVQLKNRMIESDNEVRKLYAPDMSAAAVTKERDDLRAKMNGYESMSIRNAMRAAALDQQNAKLTQEIKKLRQSSASPR